MADRPRRREADVREYERHLREADAARRSSSGGTGGGGRGGKRRSRRSRKRRLVVVLAIVIPLLALLGLAGAGAYIAKTLSDRAFEARDLLEGAVPAMQTAMDAIVDADPAAARAEVERVAVDTRRATELTGGTLWEFGEGVPVYGHNLTAVRLAAAATDRVVRDAVLPATELSLDSLTPVDGRIDIGAIRTAGEFILGAGVVIDEVTVELDTIDRENLIEQVESGIVRLTDALAEATELIDAAEPALEVLPAVLGETEPRNYLMIFQNNAESRGTGGNPAAFTLVNVDNGLIELTEQASSQDFNNNRPSPIIPLDDETEALYNGIVGTFVQNISLTPDFPTTARLAEAHWQESFGDPLDGVLSFDPIGLARLIQVTGPITLETGDLLTPENAVQLLLNEVYFRYPDPSVQDAFFAAAAASVFDAVTSGQADTLELIEAIGETIDNGNLMYWTDREDEIALLDGTRINGVLPDDNAETTLIGVYINDDTGSKMDFYLESDVGVTTERCGADGFAATVSVTLNNVLDQQTANTLPSYIQGPFYSGGRISTDLVVYGPVGGALGDVAVNDASLASVSYAGDHLGRPVVKVRMFSDPTGTPTVSIDFSGGPGEYGELEVRGTPMIREMVTTINDEHCGG